MSIIVTRRGGVAVAALGLALSLPACGGGDDGADGDDPGDGTGADDGGPALPDADPACAEAPAPARMLVTSGLERPVYLTSPPGDDRLFVLEQHRGIRVIEDGEVRETPFLDLRGLMDFASGGEEGVLGLAFHPAFATNGRFFVTFTAERTGDTTRDAVLAEFAVSADPNVAEPEPVDEILVVPADARAHYGGQMMFGADGMLYLGTGDMQPTTDPGPVAQDLGSLAGKILRIDVGDAPGQTSVPADNPFVGEAGAREEIWAYGLRVPWRFDLDAETGDLYIADVGDARIEEIDHRPAGQQAGSNFGWPVVEGSLCVGGSTCPGEFAAPIHEYEHEGPSAVIGGAVYRGEAMPCLRGRYFYADHSAGWVRSLVVVDGQAAGHEEHAPLASELPTSFGRDASGEHYILELDGDIFRIVPGD